MNGPPVTVEKRKWDGSVSARWTAALLSEPPTGWAWLARAGTRRERPWRGQTEVLERDELAVAGDGWWVVTAVLGRGGAVERYEIDAAVPVARAGPGALAFVDLDLDLGVDASGVRLQDEDDFHRRAREMGYPEDVCRGAWGGLRDAAGRYRAGAWPFDGSLADLAAGRPTP